MTEHCRIASYSQTSVLRTTEQIVGIPPMTQFDAAATPMLNSFTDTPNLTASTAIVPTQDVHQKNPVAPPTPTFGPFTSLDQVATQVDWNEELENEGIWERVNGADSTMPAPKTSFQTTVPVSTDTPGGLPNQDQQEG